MVDPLGTWGASKPSDGLGIKFPQYSYFDMVQRARRLLALRLPRRLPALFSFLLRHHFLDALFAFFAADLAAFFTELANFLYVDLLAMGFPFSVWISSRFSSWWFSWLISLQPSYRRSSSGRISWKLSLPSWSSRPWCQPPTSSLFSLPF